NMVMRVDTRTALQKRTERRAVQMVSWLRDHKVGDVKADANPERLEVTLSAADANVMNSAEAEIGKVFTDFRKVSRDGNKLVLALNENQADRFRNEAVDQAMLVIRQRIDKWGVAELDVRRLGPDSIQISLPGQQDPEQAKELIGTTAQLEFRMVDEKSNFFSQLLAKHPPPADSGIKLVRTNAFEQLEGKDRDQLLAYAKHDVPHNRQVLLQCVTTQAQKGTCDSYLTYLVDKAVTLTCARLA